MLQFLPNVCLIVRTNFLQLKHNNQPFPAVTFCNMNPYKKSAIASMPEVAQLIQSYNKASQTSRAAKSDKSIAKRRRKRQSCLCSYPGGQWREAIANGHRYVWMATNATWTCSFQCC